MSLNMDLVTGPKHGVSYISVRLIGSFIDLNWQIAHGVLYTGSRFNMTNIDPRWFCRADDETLEHLFFECELARLLVAAWVHFNLWQICPTAAVFSVTELLFGFSSERQRIVPPLGWEPALTSPTSIPAVSVEWMKKCWNTYFLNVSWLDSWWLGCTSIFL